MCIEQVISLHPRTQYARTHTHTHTHTGTYYSTMAERVLLACATVGKKIFFYGGKAAEGDEVYDTTHCLEIFI